jgi:hypothetical protein
MNLGTGTCEAKSKYAAKISLQSLMRSLSINFCVVKHRHPSSSSIIHHPLRPPDKPGKEEKQSN